MNALSPKSVQSKRNLPSNGHTEVQVQKDHDKVQAGFYKGPVPPPNIMEGYKHIDPSFPERIMREFEKNSEHIRELEREGLNATVARDKRGQICGFILALGLFAIVMFCLYLGNITFAGFGAVAFFGTMIQAFLPKNDKQNSKKNDKKDN